MSEQKHFGWAILNNRDEIVLTFSGEVTRTHTQTVCESRNTWEPEENKPLRVVELLIKETEFVG